MPVNKLVKFLEKKNFQSYVETFNHLWEITNKEINRLSGSRQSLEEVMDTIYDAEEDQLDEKLSKIIMASNKINMIKSDWHVKWSFDHWASTYDDSIDKMKQTDGIYHSSDTLLNKTAAYCDGKENWILVWEQVIYLRKYLKKAYR